MLTHKGLGATWCQGERPQRGECRVGRLNVPRQQVEQGRGEQEWPRASRKWAGIEGRTEESGSCERDRCTGEVKEQCTGRCESRPSTGRQEIWYRGEYGRVGPGDGRGSRQRHEGQEQPCCMQDCSGKGTGATRGAGTSPVPTGWAHTSSTALMQPSFSGLFVTARGWTRGRRAQVKRERGCRGAGRRALP